MEYLLIILGAVILFLLLNKDRTEGFTLRPYRMTCTKCLDNYPKYVTLSQSGGIKWVSNRPPHDQTCRKVECPENIRGPPYEPMECYWCGNPCHTTLCEANKIRNSGRMEGFKNMEQFTNEQLDYVLNTDSRISAAQHIVLDKFDRVDSLSANPPIASPGYRCVKRVCSPEYNNSNMTCWNCEVPEGK